MVLLDPKDAGLRRVCGTTLHVLCEEPSEINHGACLLSQRRRVRMQVDLQEFVPDEFRGKCGDCQTPCSIRVGAGLIHS